MHKRLLSRRVHSYGDKEANVEEKGVLGLWVYEYLFFPLLTLETAFRVGYYQDAEIPISF